LEDPEDNNVGPDEDDEGLGTGALTSGGEGGVHVVKEKQSMSSGHSLGPRGHGYSHVASASSLLAPQKKVFEIMLGLSGPLIVVVLLLGVSEPTLLQVVKGIHDSSKGHSNDVPPGHGVAHFALASA
jgi:hypothetical protein